MTARIRRPPCPRRRRPRILIGLALTLIACSSGPPPAAEQEAYIREVSLTGTVVDANAYLLHGAGGAASETPTKALLAVDGVYLLLPPGNDASQVVQQGEPQDPAVLELLRRQLEALQLGGKVRVVGRVYRRGGLQGIAMEKIVQP